MPYNLLIESAESRTLPDQSHWASSLGLAQDFARGAYSAPHDWWLAIQWSLGIQGVYGDKMRSQCEEVGRRLDLLMLTVKYGTPHVYKGVSAVLKFLIMNEQSSCVGLNTALTRIDQNKARSFAYRKAAQFAGRYSGGLFTFYASTGGRYGRLARENPAKLGFAGSHIALTLAGTVIHVAIKTGGVGICAADLMLALVTGVIQPVIKPKTWADIMRAIPECSTPIDAMDYHHYSKLIRALDAFFRDPRLAR